MSGRNVGPKSMTLLDLLYKAKGDPQHPNNALAKGPDIYGSQMMVEMLGDLYVQSEKVLDALNIAGSSTVIEDKPDAIAQIKKIAKKAAMVQKLIHSMGEDIDKFSVENPKK
jgi:hypothetical protein